MANEQKERKPIGKRLLGFLMIMAVLAIGIGIGTLVSHRVDATGPGDSQLQMQTDGKPVGGGALLALSQAFEEIANRIGPAVVNINTEEVITRRGPGFGGDSDDPMLEFFRRFGFGVPPFEIPEQQLRRSLGSGVIVDPKGYIITNNHVVEGATKIKVSLPGGQEYLAKLVGTDPVSDIAVIKITGQKDFPYAKIGNSRNAKVGDWVIAVGSPFELPQTVTAGIISAIGRTLEERGPTQYAYLNDYIQTDAAINPGNSGGPLVNMNAEVIGINSFISTTSGANAGIGFAVPSHLFVRVYNQILQSGKVARGWLGINMNPYPFTKALADFFGVKQGSGVLVTGLTDEDGEPSDSTPAAKAGIKPEDVIIAYNGKKITSNQDLRFAVAETLPGQKVKIKVIRHGQEKEFEVTIGERKFDTEAKSRYTFEEKEEKTKPEMGIEIDNVPARLAQSLDIPGGAYVTSVKPGSLAADAGLMGPQQDNYGDIIVAANGKQIQSARELYNLISSLKSGNPVVLKFLRIRDRSRKDGRLLADTRYTSIIKP